MEVPEDYAKRLQELVDQGVLPSIEMGFSIMFGMLETMLAEDSESPETLAKIQQGIDSLERGEGRKYTSLSEFREDIRREVDRLVGQHSGVEAR